MSVFDSRIWLSRSLSFIWRKRRYALRRLRIRSSTAIEICATFERAPWKTSAVVNSGDEIMLTFLLTGRSEDQPISVIGRVWKGYPYRLEQVEQDGVVYKIREE